MHNQIQGKAQSNSRMMDFNVKSMLFFMMCMSMVFSMEENNDVQILTPEYFNDMKMKFYGSKEQYEKKLKSMTKKYVTKFSWDKPSHYTTKYGDMAKHYNITDLSDNITYEIKTPYCDFILIFINPKTQTSKLFFKDQYSGKIYQLGYGGNVEFSIDSVLNFPIYYITDFGREAHSIISEQNINKTRQSIALFWSGKGKVYVNYVDKKFYYTKENFDENIFVITLEDLSPEIRPKYIHKAVLEFSDMYKLYQKQSSKYIKYTEDQYWK